MQRGESSSRFMQIVDDFSDLFSTWDCYDEFTKRDSCILAIILVHSRQGNKITTSKISDLLGKTNPAISQALKKLEQGGYIKRKVNNDDRRVVYVYLTKKGEQRLKQKDEHFKTHIDKALSKMKDEEVELFIKYAEKFIKYAKGENL
jgi:transcriptional regulator, MarR family